MGSTQRTCQTSPSPSCRACSPRMTDSSARRRPALPFLVKREMNPPGVDSRASRRLENGRRDSRVKVSRAPSRARPKAAAASEAEMP
eukprot:scaffold3460_cov115-Isochrysis_galbana.AAC.6